MQPFNEQSVCWKCGSNEVGAVYCQGPSPQRICWRSSSIGRSQEHFHRQCLRCGHSWFEIVRPVEEMTHLADDRAADAELGVLVRQMARSGMALYRTEHLNWSVRVWNKSEAVWVSMPFTGDSPEEVLRQALERLEEDETGRVPLVQNGNGRHLQ